jgi:hypothetical protein
VIPVFDVLELLNSTVIHASPDSFFSRVLHGGVTANGQLQRDCSARDDLVFRDHHRRLRARMGSCSTGRTWCRKGLPWPIYILLIPIEILGMFVRPFALTMRLAANMTGGHISILALLSLIFIFTEVFGRAIAGVGVGMVLSLPIGVGLTALELIVILGSGIRFYAVDGRVHRHGHPRSPLSTHTEE